MRDVVGRDLGQAFAAERGEEVLVEVVAVVLQGALAALGGDERIEAFEPRFGELGKGEPARRRQEPAVGFAGEQVALPAGLGELVADGFVAGCAVEEQVDAVGAVLLPVEAAFDASSLHSGDRLVVALPIGGSSAPTSVALAGRPCQQRG